MIHLLRNKKITSTPDTELLVHYNILDELDHYRFYVLTATLE